MACWNNTQEAAESLYKDLFTNMAAVAPELLGRKLAILGVIWPSKKFTEIVEASAVRLKLRIATQSFCDTFIFIVQDRWKRSQ